MTAIQKQHTTPQGVITNHHEIVRVEINVAAACVSMFVNCYTSQQAAQSGSGPVWQECITIPFAGFMVDPLSQYYGAATNAQGSALLGGTLVNA
jgi:hypothetical protein